LSATHSIEQLVNRLTKLLGQLKLGPGQQLPAETLDVLGKLHVLLHRNIVIDAETAQFVAAAVQAALQAGTPSRPPHRGPRAPAAGGEPLS
jgi:hypothetical protein